MKFRKFSSIEQFRNVIKSVRDYAKNHEVAVPTLTFVGTVKLHGTNACIAYDVGAEAFQYQSRERELTLTTDNAGFMLWGSRGKIQQHIIQLVKHFSPKESIYVYGEWAGGSIQKGVGLNNLPKRFYIFSIVVDEVEIVLSGVDIKRILGVTEDREIYSVHEFDTFIVQIDFNKPEEIQNTLVNLTIAVEDECPVARYFGFEKTIGEGIVWKNYDTGLIFKTKGEKHVNGEWKIFGVNLPRDIELRITNHMSRGNSAEFTFEFLE